MGASFCSMAGERGSGGSFARLAADQGGEVAHGVDHVVDRAVFSRRVHRLKDNEQGVFILRVENFLKLVETFDVRGQIQFRFVFAGVISGKTRIVIL